MIKNICQICQSCTPLIACKQLCVIRTLVGQKHEKFLPHLIRTGQHVAVQQPLDFHMQQQCFTLWSLFLTQRCKNVTFHRSCLHKVCTQNHPTQEQGLLIKFCQEGPHSAHQSHLSFFPAVLTPSKPLMPLTMAAWKIIQFSLSGWEKKDFLQIICLFLSVCITGRIIIYYSSISAGGNR